MEKKPSSDPTRGIVVFRDHVINQRGETVNRGTWDILCKGRPA